MRTPSQALTRMANEDARDLQFATTLARGLDILRCFTPKNTLLGNSQLAAPAEAEMSPG